MIVLDLKPDNHFNKNSNQINIEIGKKYAISVKVTGISGNLNCGYFGIVFLNQNNIEIDRKIRWLNDFSGIEKTVEIIFEGITNKILLIYRINFETNHTSHLKYDLLPLKEAKFKEVPKKTVSIFDSFGDVSIRQFHELSSKDESILEKNLVWVFGFARSGTSWLALQLLSHDTNSINEFHIDKHLGVKDEFITDNSVRLYDHLENIPSYFFSKKFRKTWSFFLRKLILNRIYAELSSFSKKIILKEPGGGLGSFDIINQCLPNSKFIILLRDGRDVIDSFIDAKQKNGFMSNFGETPVTAENRSESIRFHAEIWTNYMENLLKHSSESSSSFYFVKYEDLLKNTSDELKKIYSFLDIKISKGEIQKIVKKYDFNKIPEDQKGRSKFHRSASPGKWKEHFTPQEIQMMTDIMNQVLKKLNYL